MYIFNHSSTTNKRKLLRKNATPQEIILWSRLKGKSLGYKFRRQYSIGSYIVDFCCREKKIIIEIDGWQHKENIEYDNERTEYFKNFNYIILRFWNNEINDNLNGVIMKIEEYLK